MADTYLLEDVLARGLKIIFCGTALGHESLRQKAYYAHPGNQFWPVLHRIGLTPHQFSPHHYKHLLAYGIGLTDLCKTTSGNDNDLPNNAFDVASLKAKIEFTQPDYLAFTSKTAGAAYLRRPVGQVDYGLQAESIGRTQIFILSSTSGQARRWWREDIWQNFANNILSG